LKSRVTGEPGDAMIPRLYLLGFGVLVFLVVVVSLTLAQLAGLGNYGGFVAGAVAAIAAAVGSPLLIRSKGRRSETS
jgi:membrane protein implicated in regulation of membrane protease activity